MSNENVKRVFYLRGDVLEIEQDNDLPPVVMNKSLMELMHKETFPSIAISTQLGYYCAGGKWKPTSDQLWEITITKVVSDGGQ